MQPGVAVFMFFQDVAELSLNGGELSFFGLCRTPELLSGAILTCRLRQRSIKVRLELSKAALKVGNRLFFSGEGPGGFVEL
jgi:hypothetical protein